MVVVVVVHEIYIYIYQGEREREESMRVYVCGRKIESKVVEDVEERRGR